MRKSKTIKKRKNFNRLPELLSLLETLKLVPADMPIPDLKEFYLTSMIEVEKDAVKLIRQMELEGKSINKSEIWKDAQDSVNVRTWNLILDMSKKGFQPLINQIEKVYISERGFSISDKIKAYRVFAETRWTVLNIVHRMNDPDNIFGKKIFGFLEETKDNEITLTVKFGLSKEKTVDFFLNNHIVEALQDAPAERLRFCPVCNYVYWASRLDQKWCSKKCADVHFQKQRRADVKKRDEINENRRRNYAHKAASKKDGEN